MRGPDMHQRLAEAIDAEYCQYACRLTMADELLAFPHLERAHVLGQRHTPSHVRAHWAMLRHARRFGSARDIFGQIGRLLGAALFTWAWVPEGNTGGTNIGAFQESPVPQDLQEIISRVDT